MEYFKYEVHQNDYINKCMVSGLKEVRCRSKPAPYPDGCHVNQLWSNIISPTRRQYLEERTFEQEELGFLLCDQVYFPFESEKVEFSGFWMQPHMVYFGAVIHLNAPMDGEYFFELSTCGGIKVFVDKVERDSLYSYLRNQERSKRISLPLKRGDNAVYVMANDLAERDTQFYFKLKYTGDQVLEAWLPAAADLLELEKIRTVFAGTYLEKFNFQDNAVAIYFEKPIENAFTAQVELLFADAHTDSESRKMEVCLKPGDKKLDIGSLIYKKVGMVNILVRARAGDVKLSRTLNFEYYDETIMPTDGLETIGQRKSAALRFLSQYGLDNFQKALALIETDLEKGEEPARKIIEAELIRLNERYDCSDFRTPALIYAYRSPVFPQDLKQKIKHTLLNFRYWFDEDGNDVMWFFSENHALNFHVSEFLAGELFENEIFTNSNMTGLQHRKKAKQLLQAWFGNFFDCGFNEWNSAVYIPIDMIGFFALYDMAQDEEMRQLAKQALDKTFAVLGANSFQGVVAASYGRIYFKNLIGRRTSESSALNFIASGQGRLNQHCFATTLFALSSYVPSDEILNQYHVPSEGRVTKTVEGEERVSLYSFKTPDYIMGSAYNYHPGCTGTQEHMFQVMIKDCDTQIWINHPGEAVYFGEGRPSYFAGNGTLPLVEQNRNFARITFHLLDQEVKYTHAFCPLACFSTYCLTGKWLFLKKENLCAAIYADNGISITREGPLKNYELISPGRDNVWKVLVEYEAVYGSFEEFIKQMLQMKENLLNEQANIAK